MFKLNTIVSKLVFLFFLNQYHIYTHMVDTSPILYLFNLNCLIHEVSRKLAGKLGWYMNNNPLPALQLNISSCCRLKSFECGIWFENRNKSITKYKADWDMIIRLQWHNIQLDNTLLLPLKSLDLFVCYRIKKVFYETNFCYVFKNCYW